MRRLTDGLGQQQRALVGGEISQDVVVGQGAGI